MKINTLIVEDSELARVELKFLLNEFPFINLIAETYDIDSALSAIEQLKPELILMDIDLPGGTAFDILARQPVVGHIIFTTAFDQFALQAFQYNTVDYLLKPIKKERLEVALNKLITQSKHNQQDKPVLTLEESFFVKDGDNYQLIKVKEVEYIEALGNYSRIYYNGHVITHQASLSSIAARLNNNLFFKISRSCIVQLAMISEIQPWITGGYQLTLKDNTVLEVSRRQAIQFKKQLML